MSDNPVNDKLLRLIPRTGIALILGSEGSGKSDLGYGILESLKDSGRPIGVYGLPLEKSAYLPDWIKIYTSLEFPEGSIVLTDEAYIPLHSRGSMKNPNKFMDVFSGLVRRKTSWQSILLSSPASLILAWSQRLGFFSSNNHRFCR